MKKENINRRLLIEIGKIEASANIKKLLEELLMLENCGTSHNYKDQYRKIINNYIHHTN